MNPLRDHQQQLHQIRSSFHDSGAISVIPKPIENAERDMWERDDKSETNPEQNLNLGGKKQKICRRSVSLRQSLQESSSAPFS
jgi:hypothetical protein